jgi:hypothetical protein
MFTPYTLGSQARNGGIPKALKRDRAAKENDFPGVSREAAVAAIEEARSTLSASLKEARQLALRS